jgi:hypothetical protein
MGAQAEVGKNQERRKQSAPRVTVPAACWPLGMKRGAVSERNFEYDGG